MALFTFSGGVHPDDGKEYAKNSPITEYLPKGDVVLPVGQHIGHLRNRSYKKVIRYWRDRRLQRQAVLCQPIFTALFRVR